MALVVGTNSYISRADAETYFADRLNSSEWDDATDANKDAALIQATRMIDYRDYIGVRTDSDQALKFPRSGLVDDGVALDPDEVPQSVLDATCELALYALQEDYSALGDLDDYSSVTVGPISVETRAGSGGGKKFPPFVTQLLRFALYPSNRLVLG
jgi:hypothetical protein